MRLRGHVIEVRLYAKGAGRDFLPQTGTVLHWNPELLSSVRIDHGLVGRQAVTPFYDSMLAKLIVCGATRGETRCELIRTLEHCALLRIDGNQRFLVNFLAYPDFTAGEAITAFIGERFAEDPNLRPHQPGAEEPALAAALFCQTGTEVSTHQPGLAGRRSVAGAPWKIVPKHVEQRLEIGLEILRSGRRPRLLARLERREIAVHLLDCDGHQASAELGGIRRCHACRLGGRRLWLYGHDGNLKLLDVTRASANAQVGASSNTLKTLMDGAIVGVLVGEGERVGKGQLLLVLEATKMERPPKAGVGGMVYRVQVGRGKQVRNRQVLVEVEADA